MSVESEKVRYEYYEFRARVGPQISERVRVSHEMHEMHEI